MDPDTFEKLNVLFNFGLPVLALLLAYFIGSYLERRHFARIRKREDDNFGFPVVTFDRMPADWEVPAPSLATWSPGSPATSPRAIAW